MVSLFLYGKCIFITTFPLECVNVNILLENVPTYVHFLRRTFSFQILKGLLVQKYVTQKTRNSSTHIGLAFSSCFLSQHIFPFCCVWESSRKKGLNVPYTKSKGVKATCYYESERPKCAFCSVVQSQQRQDCLAIVQCNFHDGASKQNVIPEMLKNLVHKIFSFLHNFVQKFGFITCKIRSKLTSS